MNLRVAKYMIGKNLTFSQLRNRKYLRSQVSTLSGKILDLGCGNGEYSFILAKNPYNTVVAFDSSPELCGVIRAEISQKKTSNIIVADGDAHALPFEDASFDAVFCNTVLEHVKDPKQVVAEIQRVLKPSGKVLLSIPFLQEIHADPYDFQRYTPYGLRNLVEQQGLTVEKIQGDYGSLNAVEYLLLGSIVWRLRVGFWKNLPFGYLYVAVLALLFALVKCLHLVFFALQNKDIHFMTQVTLLARKDTFSKK